jgi:alpha-ribazole phosphatase
MTRLWLVRHGQTAWNLEGRHQGQADPPLNATGWEQARALIPRVRGLGIEAIYSSDLERAYTTARVLGEALGLPVRREPGLREINQGAWEGMLADDIRRQYAAEWARRREDPLHARAPGGESVAEVAARVGEVIERIQRDHPGGNVLIVSHGLSLATILCRAKGIPLAEAFDHIPENCDLVEGELR